MRLDRGHNSPIRDAIHRLIDSFPTEFLMCQRRLTPEAAQEGHGTGE